MTSTEFPNVEFPRTAERSRLLVFASQRNSVDPFVAIDWTLPIGDDDFHLCPETLPLFGTPLWDAMTDTARYEYSRHEAAALCGAGIWFENVLMQVVLRHLGDLPVTDPAHRYLLVEVADECRHSMMFGEFIRRANTPAYRPSLSGAALGGDEGPGARVVSYLLILAVEEILDHMNRLTMRDERVHAISREMARVHVLEEARHVSFAKTYLAEAWPTLDANDRSMARELAPALVGVVADLCVDPAVYDHLGIADGAAVARANPHHQAVIIAGLTKLTTLLDELGIIDADHRDEWSATGLIAA